MAMKEIVKKNQGQNNCRLAPRRMKSGLGIEKYDVCSNKHCSSTMCAIISLKVWIDINCAQTVDLKKKIAFCLFST